MSKQYTSVDYTVFLRETSKEYLKFYIISVILCLGDFIKLMHALSKYIDNGYNNPNKNILKLW